MTGTTDKPDSNSLEEEVWIAISAFEQILEAIPEDRASLEALSHAYGQIGDHAREMEYLLRLGNVLIAEGDQNGAQQVFTKIQPHVQNDPRAAAIADRIARMNRVEGSTLEKGAGKAKAPPESRASRCGFTMADELSFAWHLLQENQVTQEEYSSIVHDLEELSVSDTPSTISVLHALEFRTSKSLDRIMGFSALGYSTPIVALSSFAIPIDAMTLLPADFMLRRGVLPFEFIGHDALVVIMNPHNKALRAEVEELTERKCHFFLALPSEFDAALTRVCAALTEKSARDDAEDAG